MLNRVLDILLSMLLLYVLKAKYICYPELGSGGYA